MEFSNTIFIFGFLPIILLIYCISPENHKNKVLFFSNLIFYFWIEPIFIFLLLFLMLIDFFSGKYIYKFKEIPKYKNLIFWPTVIINCLVFIIFKFSIFNFYDVSNIYSKTLLPFGLSIYIFQGLSYVIDLYLKKSRVQNNFIDFGVFMAFFPQLVCGPILRYGDMKLELSQREFSSNKIFVGFNYFIKGLAKKIFLADTFLLFWNDIKHLNYEFISVLSAWLGAFCLIFGIYFYLSAYSDMSIGIGKIFGFNLPLNFNYPYMSKSITEFSRKFNTTLINWYKTYIFTPIGSNITNKGFLSFRFILIWFLIGLWYGSSLNFIMWGLILGIIMILEGSFLSKVLVKLPKIIQHIYTLIILILSFVLFGFNSLSESFNFYKRLFTGNLIDNNSVYINYLTVILPLIIIGIIFSTNFGMNFTKKLEDNNPNVIKWTRIIMDIVLSLLCFVYIISQNYLQYDSTLLFNFL